MRHVPAKEMFTGGVLVAPSCLSGADIAVIAQAINHDGPNSGGHTAGRQLTEKARSDGLEAVLSRAGVGILHRDLDGHVLMVNDAFCAIVGRAAEALDALPFERLLHPDDRVRSLAIYSDHLARAKPFEIEQRYSHPDGSFVWGDTHVTFVSDGNGCAQSTITIVSDITARRETETALRKSEERFRLAAQAAGLGIWDYDALRNRREWSPEFKSMLGLREDVTPNVATALALVVPEDRPLLQALVDSAQAGDTSARFEVILRVDRADDGARRWMRTDGWRIHAPSGRLERVLVTIRDVTEERTAEERIRWTATHDALTRIANRAFFTEQLEAAIARAKHGSRISLVLLDIDHLKEVNDTIGHDAGDVLLRVFAHRLKRAFGYKTLVGRLGGDEFAVLLEGVAREDIAARVDSALETLRQPFEHEGYACDTQATAGASIYPTDGTTAADLLKSADIALYAGKAGRRGELSMFEPVMRAGVQRRASMLNMARIAVRDDLVVPFYQPKLSLATRRVVGFEALLRWRHSKLGIQGPDTIAPAFDDFGLALGLSNRMLESVARDLRAWLDDGIDPGRIAINLSPADFRNDKLAERVLAPLARWDVPYDRIELEITETVLLDRDTDRVSATLGRFHDKGVTIALDDFGTGFASLTHLKTFPVDVLKIDKSFVSNLCDGTEDAAIVDSIIDLAGRLKIDVVAEGVEREEQARYLTAQGCGYAQGYLFGRPAPAETVRGLIAPDG